MSSIRLFILGALSDHGEMHGHQLRNLAELERVQLWTDVTVGALYGALKRLAVDGLIEAVRTEQVGSYPERQVWAISRHGRVALARLREDGLREVVFRTDPVDLALARQDPQRFDDIPQHVAARLTSLRTMLDDAQRHEHAVAQYLTPLEVRVMSHKRARLLAEIAWHETLLADLPALLAGGPHRKDHLHD